MATEYDEISITLSTHVYVHIFRMAVVKVEPSWWSLRNTQSSFWRFYRQESEGAEIHHNGTAIVLQARRLYFIPAGLQFSTYTRCDVKQFYIHFGVHGLPHALINEVLSNVVCFPELPHIEAETERLSCDVVAGYEDQLELQCRAAGVLYGALAHFMAHLSADQRERYVRQSNALAPVAKAIQAIEQSYMERLPNADLANLCFMSETYFITRFRECVGMTPGQYLQAYRIRMAAQSLLFSNATVERVGELNGFGSRSYFIRTFHSHTGMTPSEYRRAQRV